MRSFLHALSFLSILPAPRTATNEPLGGGMFAAFPFTGAFLGALLGLAWHGANIIFDPLLAAALAVAAWAMLTRFFHLDGVADCADALWGGFTPERRLEILKDPRCGTFGVTAVVLVLLMKTAALAALANWLPQSLLSGNAAHPWTLALWRMAGGALVLATGRWCVFPILLRSTPARESGLGRGAIDAGNSRVARYLGMDGGSLLILAVSGAVFLPAVAVLPAAALCAFTLRLVFTRALGGVSGDVMGAAIELGEVVALLALAVCMRWGVVGV